MRARLLLGVVILALVMTTQPSCDKQQGGAVRLAAVSGTATVNGQPAKAGAALKAGDVVEVVQGSAARVAFADGSSVLVFHDAKRQKNGILRIAGPREGDFKTMLLKLSDGVCAFLVPPKRANPVRFEIEGSSSITAIHGTEGKVAILDGGDLVAIKDGRVEVRSAGGQGTVSVGAGEQVFVPQGQAPGTPEKYQYLTPSERIYYKGTLPQVKTF